MFKKKSEMKNLILFLGILFFLNSCTNNSSSNDYDDSSIYEDEEYNESYENDNESEEYEESADIHSECLDCAETEEFAHYAVCNWCGRDFEGEGFSITDGEIRSGRYYDPVMAELMGGSAADNIGDYCSRKCAFDSQF